MEIQAKKMILLIYDLPELWDTSSESYKDRNKKKDGWTQALFNDFGKKSGEKAMIFFYFEDILIHKVWKQR